MSQREYFLRYLFSRWGLFLLPVVAIFAFSIPSAWNESVAAAHLEKEGATAVGWVTGLGKTDMLARECLRRNPDVRFRFIVDGVTHDSRQSVKKDFYCSLRVGKPILVHYWVGDTRVNEIEPGAHARKAWTSRINAGLAALAVLIFVGLGWRWATLASWMAKNGVRKEARVTRLDVTGSLKSVTTTYFYSMVWQNDNGREGSSRGHKKEDLPAVGTTITILTDPTGRRASVWEGDL